MTFRQAFGLVVAVVILALLLNGTKARSAAKEVRPKVQIKITPATPQERSDKVQIDGAFDNLDGTSTILIHACGSKIEAVILNSAMASQDPETIHKIQAAIAQVCKDEEFTKGN